jgi:hypothetical protein
VVSSQVVEYKTRTFTATSGNVATIYEWNDGYILVSWSKNKVVGDFEEMVESMGHLTPPD